MKKLVKKVNKFNVDDYVTKDLNRQDIIQIKQAFDIFDGQEYGIVDPNQLKYGMVNLFMGNPLVNLFRFVLYQNFGEQEEQAGGIDFPQFLKLATAKLSDKENRADIMRVFNSFDVNRSGKFTTLELKKVAKDIGEDLTDEQIKGMFKKADLDNDGFVTAQDFYNIMTHRVYWDK